MEANRTTELNWKSDLSSSGDRTLKEAARELAVASGDSEVRIYTTDDGPYLYMVQVSKGHADLFADAINFAIQQAVTRREREAYRTVVEELRAISDANYHNEAYREQVQAYIERIDT